MTVAVPLQVAVPLASVALVGGELYPLPPLPPSVVSNLIGVPAVGALPVRVRTPVAPVPPPGGANVKIQVPVPLNVPPDS